MHYFLATFTYTCSCGRANHLYRYMAANTKSVNHVNLMPYMPRTWPCSGCKFANTPFVELSVKFFTPEEASESSIAFEAIVIWGMWCGGKTIESHPSPKTKPRRMGHPFVSLHKQSWTTRPICEKRVCLIWLYLTNDPASDSVKLIFYIENLNQ